MGCKKYEKLLLRSFDHALKNKEKEKLENHLKSCLLCQAKRKEYKTIFDILRKEEPVEPKPYFWERLQTKIKEKGKYTAWSGVKYWSMRAVPFSLLLILLLTLALVFLSSPKSQELSQSEVLLLRNLNPLQEERQLLEEEAVENQNMMIIFSAMEAKNGTRRYLP